MNWKKYLRRILNKFGYDVVRCYGGKRNAVYMPCTPYTYRTFAPWFSAEFQVLYSKVSNNTIVKEDRCYIIHRLANHCSGLPGNVAECGVFKGGTAFVIADALRQTSKRVRLYDTFSGFPEGTENDPSGHKAGGFGNASLQAVKAYLSDFPSVEYAPGVIPETFNHTDKETYCFVHVDVDLYRSVYDCCVYFYPRLVAGGVMIFDDYGFEPYIDAGKKAVDDFFLDKPEVPFSLRTGQCILIKLPDAQASERPDIAMDSKKK
jgi:O-methyltransferase